MSIKKGWNRSKLVKDKNNNIASIKRKAKKLRNKRKNK